MRKVTLITLLAWSLWLDHKRERVIAAQRRRIEQYEDFTGQLSFVWPHTHYATHVKPMVIPSAGQPYYWADCGELCPHEH